MKYRISNKGSYTVISNTCIRDKNLSLKAKGLHTLMMSLPDNWEYSISGLAAICKESETAVRTAVRELISAGYIRREKVQNRETGFHGWIYNIYEEPQDCNPDSENPTSENPTLENPTSENPTSENRRQINKDKLNKDIINKDEQNISAILSKIQNERLKAALREFLGMRREMKRPLGAAALKMLIKNLYEMSDSTETRIGIIEQSVRNNWRDIYALKEDYGAAGAVTSMSPTADPDAIEAKFMERVAV
ncbi:MAG: helix-turn-helix domain-containing protein [Candidatus Ornithomonoglobus sp.]